jgi:hypothetical protein
MKNKYMTNQQRPALRPNHRAMLMRKQGIPRDSLKIMPMLKSVKDRALLIHKQEILLVSIMLMLKPTHLKSRALHRRKRETPLDSNKIMPMLKLGMLLIHKVLPLLKEEILMYRPSPLHRSKQGTQWHKRLRLHNNKPMRMRNQVHHLVNQVQLTLRTHLLPKTKVHLLRMCRPGPLRVLKTSHMLKHLLLMMN